MDSKRLRMFAGPNGSGKSTIFNKISSQFDLGIYLNADEIEQILSKEHKINLHDFKLSSSSNEGGFETFLHNHSLYKKAISEGFKIDLECNKNIISIPGGRTHSYEASILTDFIRTQLITEEKKLTFETVMSHSSRIETLKRAKELGYKNYLYYVCTENVEINKSRVAERVKSGGHDVPPQKIEQRYDRSLALLKEAVSHTYRTFIFDNSQNTSQLILDVYKGKEVTFQIESIPLWVDKYFLNL